MIQRLLYLEQDLSPWTDPVISRIRPTIRILRVLHFNIIFRWKIIPFLLQFEFEFLRSSAPCLTRLNRKFPDPVRRTDPVQSGVFPPPRGGAGPLSPVAVVGSIFLVLVLELVQPGLGGLLDGLLEGRLDGLPVGSLPAGI